VKCEVRLAAAGQSQVADVIHCC